MDVVEKYNRWPEDMFEHLEQDVEHTCKSKAKANERLEKERGHKSSCVEHNGTTYAVPTVDEGEETPLSSPWKPNHESTKPKVSKKQQKKVKTTSGSTVGVKRRRIVDSDDDGSGSEVEVRKEVKKPTKKDDRKNKKPRVEHGTEAELLSFDTCTVKPMVVNARQLAEKTTKSPSDFVKAASGSEANVNVKACDANEGQYEVVAESEPMEISKEPPKPKSLLEQHLVAELPKGTDEIVAKFDDHNEGEGEILEFSDEDEAAAATKAHGKLKSLEVVKVDLEYMQKERPRGQKKLSTDNNCLYNVVEFPSTLSSRESKTTSIKVGAYSDVVPKTNTQLDLCNKWFDQLQWFQRHTTLGNRGTLMLLNHTYLNMMDYLIKRDPEWVKRFTRTSFDHVQLLETNKVGHEDNKNGTVYSKRYNYADLDEVDHEFFVKLPMPSMVEVAAADEPVVDPEDSISNKDAQSVVGGGRANDDEVSITGVSRVTAVTTAKYSPKKPRKLCDGSPLKRTFQYPRDLDNKKKDNRQEPIEL